jgi:uncharacterized membrane protein
MTVLILGLVVFFVPHLFTLQRQWRTAAITRLGEAPYKGIYALVSSVGLGLVILGFGRYRAGGMIPVWDPPVFTRHIAIALMWPALVLLTAAYLPPGEIKRRAKHPMLAAVKIWALAHLLANGDLGSILLFGSILAYAVVDRIALKHRQPPAFLALAQANRAADLMAVVAGSLLFALIAVYLHPLLIGVPVLPR